jgi:hypothetical protein
MSNMSSFLNHNKNVLETLLADPMLIYNEEWRLFNLYWIITKAGTKEPFRMNRAQKHFYENYLKGNKKHHRHLILKSRQLGFTTFFDIYILDQILFSPNKDGFIIAHTAQKATEIFDKKIDYALRNMCPEVKDTYFKLNRNSARAIQAVIDYGPQAGATSTIKVGTSPRGDTIHYLHVSEFAKMSKLYPQNAKEVVTGGFPAVPDDGFIFIESTAEGMSGEFYDMFQTGWNKKDLMTPERSKAEYVAHFYNWTWDDEQLLKMTDEDVIPVETMEECDIPWGAYQKEHNLSDKEMTYYYRKWHNLNRDTAMLRQEYPTTPEEAFVNSGEMYFPTQKTVALLQVTTKGDKGELHGPVFAKVDGGSLTIYKQPEKGKTYVLGGDTAEGLAHGDFSIGYVIDKESDDCVALYRAKVPPDEYADEMIKLGKYYNNALMAIENNKDGLWVNSVIEKKGYQNLYYRKAFDDITQNMTKYYGWKTTSSTRPYMLAELKSVINKKQTGFPEELLKEMLTFVRNTRGKAEAMAGQHDDVIMAAAIAYSVARDTIPDGNNQTKNASSLMHLIFGEVA